MTMRISSTDTYLPIGILVIFIFFVNILGVFLFLRGRRLQLKHRYTDPCSPEDQRGIQYWISEDVIPETPNLNHPSFLSHSEEIQFLHQQLDELKAHVEQMRLRRDQISYGNGNYSNTIRNDDMLSTCPLLDLDVAPPPAYTVDSRSHMAISDLSTSEDDHAPYPRSYRNGRDQG